MLKKILLAITFLATIQLSYGQQKDLTLEDAIMGGYSKFRISGPSQLDWIPNQNTISWVNADTANPSIIKRALPDGKEEIVISLNDIKSIEEFNELKKMPRFKWINEKEIKIQNGPSVYSINLDSKNATKLYYLPKAAANFDLKDDKLAYTKGQNLLISVNGNETQITNDSIEGVVNGQSVHRYEFGISKGIFWSNSGESLAFYRKDENMVTNYPLTNFTTKPAELNSIKYPMAGMPSHEVTIGVYSLKSNKTVWLNTGTPADQYLTNIAWGTKDKFIYVAILNRDQNHMKLNQYDANSGEFIKTLIEEKDEKYVQPLHPMEFIPGHDDKFLWQSEKDGYSHIYTYNTKGKLLKQVTQGEWVVAGTHGFDSAGNIIITRADNKGLDRVIYKYNPLTGKETPWITQSGTHYIKTSSDGMFAIDRFSSLTNAYTLNIIDSKGKVLEELKKVDNPLSDYNVSLPELGTIKTNEGIELNTRIIKPFDFDPSKKYKALVYVYNGPGVQLITNSWMAGASLWMPYMANKGYIIFTVDGRGSENRGKDFEQAIFRQVGEYELVDQLAGVEYLRGLDYVDSDKMAVHGWSYGGFMTTSLMLKAPGIFKVGVAGGPVMDWKYYEIMYTERYMDTPEDNVAGFAKASLLDKVENLKGDLLIIHGADDDVVVPQHSIDFLKQSIDKGVQVDFFLYPGHKHNVRGKDRIHLMRKVLDYIDDKLE